MRRTPVVLGVLSMVFGSLVAAWSAFGLATQSLMRDMTSGFTSSLLAGQPHKPGMPDPAVMMQSMQKMVDELKPYTYMLSGGMIVFSLALVVVGFGLYKRQPWSRPASLLWGAAALADIPFMLWVQTSVIIPKTQAMMTEMFAASGMPSGVFDAAMGMQKGILVVTHILFYAPFPVLLLILMGRSSAKNDLLT
jgi:hypothetical protein